jgi:hypothetical protein
VPDDYVPSIGEPLVYHLFGSDNYSASLVLSEDDHIEFMLQASRWAMEIKPASGTEPRPAGSGWLNSHVRMALGERLLLLVGYEENGGDLRALLWGLSNPIKRRSGAELCVAVQVYPPDSEKVRDFAGYKKYLEQFFDKDFNFKVFWERPEEFMVELRNWGGT